MESPAAVTNPVLRSDRLRENRRRRKKMKSNPQPREENSNSNQNPSNSRNQFSWKSEKTEKVYSSKLLQALKKVRLSPSSSTQSVPRRGRAVREAADRALAVAAKGRTRWSRAILTNRLKLKFMKNKRGRGAMASSGSGGRARKQRLGMLKVKAKNMPAVQRKVRVLGRLVPGCRKEPLPVILEETSDYIEALEMQIRALKTLTDFLTRSRSSSDAGAGAGAGAGEASVSSAMEVDEEAGNDVDN